MLTKELAIADFDRGRLIPDRLNRQQHARYLRYAECMLRIYRQGIGRTRRELHRQVLNLMAAETDCPLRRIDAFCKLLDDAGRFHQDRRGRSAALRREVFQLAAASHPLVSKADQLFEQSEQQVKARIASQLGQSWDELEGRLFEDIIEFHRLKAFDGYPNAQALLARYNVAQVQVALFDALEMTVWATDDFKTILRYAKLARLMHTIRRHGDGGFEIRFDGPASILRETRRYGTAMAKFLPALIACRNWRMHAALAARGRRWRNHLVLSSADGLNSHLPPPREFDSSVEEAFAAKWGTEPRDGWTLLREGEILDCDQHVFVPDFVLRHADGRRVLLEIVGFWTPEYLEAKLQTLRRFARQPILLAVAQAVTKQRPDFPAEAIRYKSALKLKDVLERLNG